MATRSDHVPIDPDAGIPDLIRRLTDDSKRLASDEVRLAKLELGESIHSAARGAVWVGLAFGTAVIAAAAFTVFLTAVIGRLFNFNYWVGALITGALELGIGFLLIKRGVKTVAEPSYSFEETRESLKNTTAWAAAQRAD